MLGDVIGEANGTLTSTEVLSVEQGSPRLRLTLRGSGKAMGVAFTDMITHSLEVRSSGVLYGEGETVWLTEDGEISTWKGFGVGRPTGASGRAPRSGGKEGSSLILNVAGYEASRSVLAFSTSFRSAPSLPVS